MTTTTKKQPLGTNPPIENTEGAPMDGFQDPTGEYPKREYHYGSSINLSARGLKVENLYLGGSVNKTDFDLEDQEPSRFPFNQVKETSSGHVISYDDTPGGERILIKHRKGAGVEIRADGSVVISALKNKVEVTGGDQTVIVEGNGKLVYNGNLNLEVTGDYNVNVGGDYNVDVQGNINTSVRKNNFTTVGLNTEYVTKGTATYKTIEHEARLVLGNEDHIVKGYWHNNVGAEIEMFSANRFTVSAEEEFSMSSLQGVLTATHISVLGMKGAIGGEAVEFTGPVYMGPQGAVPFTSGASFYGSFHGQASEAIESYNANVAQKAEHADAAYVADFHISGVLSPADEVGEHGETAVEATESQENQLPNLPIITVDPVTAILTEGHLSIKTITIDSGDSIREATLLRDDFAGLFEKVPTMMELRSSLRDVDNRELLFPDETKLVDKLVSIGFLSSDWKKPLPKKIGRVAKKDVSPRFGYNALGNSITNRGKRFR